MEQNKQIIQFSDHVKNKIRSRQITPFSFSSDELILSDDGDDEDESSISIRAQNTFRKRSSTFVTCQILPRTESESYFAVKRIGSKQNQLCQECLRRENLLQNEHENFLHIQKENKKLSEQIRLLNLVNQQYQEENSRLKQHLTKLNFHLREYQINFDLLKQKTIAEKNHQTKQDMEDTHLRRLRHEIQVYQQVIAEKRREKQKETDYFYQFRNK